MTPDLARRVRALRADDESWRGVSQEIFDHPEGAALKDWTNMRGHQPLGQYLCEAAAKALGEDVNQEPW